jgi:hypothetical protein
MDSSMSNAMSGTQDLDAKVWGPHFWFTLHTIAITYPNNPNDVVKKKYYDFIQNLPLFIPTSKMGNAFSEYLDEFPVTPYLDSRMSIMKWVHFIHNKINAKLGKDELDFFNSLDAYYDHYKPKEENINAFVKHRHKIIFGSVAVSMLILLAYLYKK